MSNVYFQPGAIVGGQCEIIRPVGIGKMGVVYLCRHVDLPDMRLALKVLTISGPKRGSSSDDEYITRFQNELTATYRINNPHVVRTYGYIAESDWVGYTMEFVDGGDLSRLIDAASPLPVPNVVKLLIQACDGVQAIHDAGIIHRDLKPANILLTQDGDAKITDFGIARMPGLPRLTATGNLLGTFEYLSPQYLQDGIGSTLGDIYALGVIGFEMVTGAVPFNEVGLFNMITAKVNREPPEAHTINAECPPALSEVIAIALRRNVEDRYQSAAEMKSDLELIYESYQFEDDLEELAVEMDEAESLELEQALSPGRVPPTIVGGRTIESIVNPNVFEQAEIDDDIRDDPDQLPTLHGERDGDTVFMEGIDDPVIAARAKLKRPVFVSMSAAGTLMAVGFLVGFAVLAQFDQSDFAYNDSIASSSEFDDYDDTLQIAMRDAMPPEIPQANDLGESRARFAPSESSAEVSEQSNPDIEEPPPSVPDRLVDITKPVMARELSERRIIENKSLEDRVKALSETTAEIEQPPAPIPAVKAAESEDSPPARAAIADSTPAPTNEPVRLEEPKEQPAAAEPAKVILKAEPTPALAETRTADAKAAEEAPEPSPVKSPNPAPTSFEVAGLRQQPAPEAVPTSEAVSLDDRRLDSLPLDLQVRATLLFRFADYVEWPAGAFHSPSAPVQLCLFKNGDFVSYLTRRARQNSTRGGRRFNLLQLNPNAGAGELASCHIIYLASEFSSQADRIASAVASRPILYVTEDTGRGVIDFVIAKRRVKFAVNTGKAEQAGIRVGSLLLDLAIETRAQP